MGFIIGYNKKQVRKILIKNSGALRNGRVLSFANDQIWPQYVWGNAAGEHKGGFNVLKSYDGRFVEGETKEIDPGGGTFKFAFNCGEDSKWHILKSFLKCPSWIHISKVYETGTSASIVTNPSYDNTIGGYWMTPEVECESNINVTVEGTIDENTGTSERTGNLEIYIIVDALQTNIYPAYLIGKFKQGPNILFDTRYAWVNSNAYAASMASISPTQEDPYATTGYLYLAVTFGISIDGGRSWVWQPMNDHINTSTGFITNNKGTILTNVKQYITVEAELPANDPLRPITLTVEDPTSASQYFVVPIKYDITSNIEANNKNNLIEYDFTPQPAGSGYEFNSPAWNEDGTRELCGVSRYVTTSTRSVTVRVKCTYPHHEFTF